MVKPLIILKTTQNKSWLNRMLPEYVADFGRREVFFPSVYQIQHKDIMYVKFQGSSFHTIEVTLWTKKA